MTTSATTPTTEPDLADTLVRDWPRLTRFYGLKPRELARMPRYLARYYVECIDELEAEETLTAFLVSDFPHYEKTSRDYIERQVKRRLRTVEEEPTIDLKTQRGRMAVERLGFGVKYTQMGENKSD